MQHLTFFKANKHPRDWGFAEYLKFDHGKLAPRKVLDGWRKSLEVIMKASDKEFSKSQRKRAAELHKRYKEKGKGSDRAYGREWLAGMMKGSVAPPVQIGVLFQGPISNSSVPVSQSNNGQGVQTAEADDSDVNDGDLGNTTGESDLEDDEPEEDDRPLPTEVDSAAPASFRDAYNEMRQECKWVLASGRIAEDVIFDACQAMDTDSFANSLAQSFVLDMSDPVVQKWFTEDEWAEIKSSVLPLPKPDIVLADSMKRFFQVKSTSTLREVLDKHSYLPEGVSYDGKVHFNSQWADVVIRRFLMLLEAPGEPLRASHLEDWYSSYLWSSILDDCLLDLSGMTVERKESPCRATSIRKNRNRTKTKRMKIGCRLDAIIRTVEDDYYEYGAMEVARTFNGVTSTKWLGDSFKLAKALRDMLFRLHELVDNDEIIVKRLQVVGVANAGLSFQYVRMNHPNGYVCLLHREKLQQVPKAVQGISELMRLLMSVAQMKAGSPLFPLVMHADSDQQIIKDCAAAVDERHTTKTVADFYKELIDDAASNNARLGWATDTP